MDSIVYYHLYSRSIDPIDPCNDWYEESRRTWLCTGCLNPKATITQIDVFLAENPHMLPIGFVAGVRVGLMSLGLLREMGEEVVRSCLHIGRVFLASGRASETHVSFRGNPTWVIRGNQQSSHRFCELCGQLVYHPMGERYLVRSGSTDALVAESQFHQLIVSENLFSKVRLKKQSRLAIDHLEVLEEARDGKTKM